MFSDILLLHNSGEIEELATYSLPGNKALNAYFHYEYMKNKNTYQYKDSMLKNIVQSNNNPRIWNFTFENGNILSAIERD
jgi:hypothetical protein